MEKSIDKAEIKANLWDQEEEEYKNMVLNAALTNLSISTLTDPSIFFKGNNQRFIALAYNPVYHTQTKHIDIQYYYIYNKVAAG